MTIETAIDALTTQTSGLLEVCAALKTDVTTQIAEAVLVSENAALSPLVKVATSLVDMQAMLITRTVSALVREENTQLALISIAKTTINNQTLLLTHIATGL